MKRISFFLALVLTVCSFGLANAQNTIDMTVSGLFNDDTVGIGSDVSIVMEWNVDAGINTKITGFTNAFQVYSSVGAVTWDTVEHAYHPDFPNASFDGGTFKPAFSLNGGINPDTVSFGGFTIFGDGAQPGASFNAYTVNILNIQGADGDVVCFDSVSVYASGTWKWTDLTSDIFPVLQWNGMTPPFCWTLYEIPNLPPQIDNPAVTLTGSHCSPIMWDYDASDVDGPAPITFSVTDGPGSIDPSTGVYTYNPTLADVGAGLTVTIQVCDALGACSDIVENLDPTNVAPFFTKGCDVGRFGQTGNDITHDFDADDNCPGDPLTFSVADDGGADATYSFDQVTGTLTANFNTAFTGTWIIEVSDGVDASTCELRWDITEGAPYAVDIEDVGCSLEPGDGVIQGTFVDVDVDLLAAPEAIGAFNLLIAYDASALSFSEAHTDNSALYNQCGWEYFTYRVGADGNCNGGCPTGLVRAVGFAETNAPGTPDEICSADTPVNLFTMSFLVTSDLTFECQEVPIRFFWLDCGDNTLSNWDGTQLFINAGVYNADVNMAADIGFPSYVGAPDVCLEGDKTEALRAVDFFNGKVCIICTGEIDDRGDINLDGLDHTVADAVMLTNYLLYGPSAFPVFDASYAASDINADGLAASVADLVYLIRVIVGDAQPYAPSGYGKISPVTAELQRAGGVLSMEDVEVSGMHLVLAGDVEATLLANNLTMQTHFDGTNTNLVISTPIEADQIYSAQGALVDIGSAEIVSMDIATSQGVPVHSNVNVLPTAYELSQNYPNPFNPTTTISFSLPVASDYSLKIYNITGQLVKEFNGSAGAGVQTVEVDMGSLASGVYFYKLDAGNFTDTKKMVMLK